MNRIIISMGDPAGIGPEIILKYFSRKDNRDNAKIVVVGTTAILEKCKTNLNINVNIKKFETFEQINNNDMYVIDVEKNIDDVEVGKPSVAGGSLSMAYLDTALKMVQEGKADALVTAPISKEAINLAGYKYAGHTEFLAEKTGTKDFGMVLRGDKITVILNSTHVSLNDAVKKVKKDSIYSKILLAERARKELGIKGKIAVAGLNPHNGENGLFGNEEAQEIEPAVKLAQAQGIDVEGPVVPDTLFVKMLRDRYGIAVVMYHDQGLIPMKMESFGHGVNITVGLPIIRTSVDHGTAYDIAGKGIADEGSLRKAVENAVIMIHNKKN